MNKLLISVIALAASIAFGCSTATAETTECTEITSLPATINTQGVYCLKQNLVTAITSGNAITINANNVTIDLNGWKLGGAAAGTGTTANGIFAQDRKNIIIRNGSIRGYYRGIFLSLDSGSSSGHIVEDILADGNRHYAILVEGDNTTIRNNKVTNTGAGTANALAFGVVAREGNNFHIQGNTIAGVDESFRAFGIVVENGNNAEVRNNRVFDLRNATDKFGIVVSFSDLVVLKDNTVSTEDGGITGIGDFSDSNNVACLDNQVSGFTADFSGCNSAVGNVSF